MAIISFTRELYFTTSTVVDWIDVFTRPVYKNIVVESLRYCQAQKGLDIYAWVLMTNHLHTIVGIRKPETSIGDILRDFKKFTSKSIVMWSLLIPAMQRELVDIAQRGLHEMWPFPSLSSSKT